MESYILFLIIATATVLSPGPGVVLTLTNTIRYGVSGAIGGIFGIASGTFIVAGISATSLGIILATSSIAFTIVKFIGAGYLIYLGLKLWRSPVVGVNVGFEPKKKRRIQFFEGLTLQLTNPKPVFFFLSIFPQFVNFDDTYKVQFVILVSTFSTLLVIIHLLYASLAHYAKNWLSSENGGRAVNRIGGGTFMCFGIGLASASK